MAASVRLFRRKRIQRGQGGKKKKGEAEMPACK